MTFIFRGACLVNVDQSDLLGFLAFSFVTTGFSTVTFSQNPLSLPFAPADVPPAFAPPSLSLRLEFAALFDAACRL